MGLGNCENTINFLCCRVKNLEAQMVKPTYVLAYNNSVSIDGIQIVPLTSNLLSSGSPSFYEDNNITDNTATDQNWVIKTAGLYEISVSFHVAFPGPAEIPFPITDLVNASIIVSIVGSLNFTTDIASSFLRVNLFPPPPDPPTFQPVDAYGTVVYGRLFQRLEPGDTIEIRINSSSVANRNVMEKITLAIAKIV